MRSALRFFAVSITILVCYLPTSPSAFASPSPTSACSAGPRCDDLLRNVAFPNYQSVCYSYECNYVAAANWEQVVVRVTPGVALLKSSYAAVDPRGLYGLSANFLWTQWTSSGIDGKYLLNKTPVPKNFLNVESAIKSSRAIFVQFWLPVPATIGTARWGAGTKLLISDGFTPLGPLVVSQGRTLAMTWAQWNAYEQSAWELTVSQSSPTDSTTPAAVTQPTAQLILSPNTVSATGGPVTATFSSTNAVTCSLLALPVLLSSTTTVPCNGSYFLYVPGNSAGGSFTVTFTATNSQGVGVTASQVLTQNAEVTISEYAANDSTNWSGYVVPSSNALVTDAEGTWSVPQLNCADTPLGRVSVWIGIGGESWATGGSSGLLLQTGISSVCSGGVQTNDAWWELYPSNPNYERIFTSFPITTGDQITAAVYQATTGAWVTKLSNLNTGLSAYMITGLDWGVGTTASGRFSNQGSTSQLSYSGGYTAEWIVEDFTNSLTQTMYPLANFGTVSFSNLASSFTSWSLTPDETWAIVQNYVTLATPSAAQGDGFSVTYVGP